MGIRLKKTMLPLGASLVFPLQALAADIGGGWRSTYDVVMMWVNFVILVALLVKFLRKPLGRFLTSQRDAIKKAFDDLEAEKARISNDIQALRESMEARRQKAEERHRRLVEQARRERRDIIETAREEAQRRIAKARQQIDARHREARYEFTGEAADRVHGADLRWDGDAFRVIAEVEGEPGWYSVGMAVQPHFKYMGADFTLSLKGKLDKS